MKQQASATPINPLLKIAKDFRVRRGWRRYVPEPIETLEADMRNEDLPTEWRVLRACIRFSWGHYSDWAVDRFPQVRPTDPKPEAVTQEELGRLIEIPKSTIHDAVQLLRSTGHLRNHKFLFPEDHVKSTESTNVSAVDPDSPDFHSPNFRHFQDLVIAKDEQAKIIPQLELERKRYQDQAAEVSKEIAKRRKHVWKLWQDYRRGKNPLGLDEKTIRSLLVSTDIGTAS